MSRLEQARAAARAVLEHLGIEEPAHIRLEDIAWHLGADVVAGAVEGAEAVLTVRGRYARIRLNASQDPRRARFSIAHEIGHLMLHRDRLTGLGQCDMSDWRREASLEAEANAFAAELLLPSTMLLDRCQDEPSFELVREIAAEFETSLTAAAVSYVRITTHPAAVVQVERGAIKWSMRGRSFEGALPPRGAPVPPGSAASRCLDGADELTLGLDAAVWLGPGATPTRLVEHAAAQPEYSAALSLLCHEPRT